jgi:hypothetical protein
VLFRSNPSLAKTIPGFIISYLKRIVHQDELNVFLRKWGHLKDAALIEAGLKHFEINERWKVKFTEFFNPCTFVSDGDCLICPLWNSVETL